MPHVFDSPSRYHFLDVDVCSNPTWTERRCQARKEMQLVSTSRFLFKLENHTFRISGRTPILVERFGSTPNKGKELSSNKVKAGFQVCGLCIHAFADEVQVGKKSLQEERQ